MCLCHWRIGVRWIGWWTGNNRFIFSPVWVGRKVVWSEASAGGCRFLLSQAGEDEDHLIFLKCGKASLRRWAPERQTVGRHLGPLPAQQGRKSVKRAKKGYCRLLCHKNHREFWEIFPACLSVFLNGKTESAQNYLYFFLKSAGIVLLPST